MCPPATTEIMGAAEDGEWPKAQIKQTGEDDWAERFAQK
jgi:hypothetical protein